MSNPTAPPPGYNESIEDDKNLHNVPYPSTAYSGYHPPAAYPATGQPPYPAGPPPGFNPEQEPLKGYPGHGQSSFQAPPPPSAVSAADYGSHPLDAETGGFTQGSGFSSQHVRRLFIRKVYITLAVQLLFTFGIVCCFTFIEEAKLFVQHNPAVYYTAYGVFLTLYITLVCCENVRRKHPVNIILLALFTLAFAYMVGTIAGFYNTKSVVIALGITAAVCVSVTLFSIQTKFDFTKCSGLLFVLSLVLMLFGFVTIFTYGKNWYLDVVYGALGALVFTLFLAFDTQLIIGGKKHEIDPEEHILGALLLYVDVVYIFLFILSLFGDN